MAARARSACTSRSEKRVRMATLRPKARDLIEAGRSAYRSTAEDRERVEAALRSRLGPEVLSPDGGAVVSATTSWPVMAGVAIGVVALAGAVFLALRPEPTPRARTAADAAPTSTAAHAPVASLEPAARLPTGTPPSATAPPPKPTTSPRDTRDRLGQEVALLSRATTALLAGDAETALRLLAEHQRRFPGGALRVERIAARARALCLLGRTEEAQLDLASLAPDSPAAASARRACDSAEAARKQSD